MHCAQVLFTLLLFHVPVFVLSHVGTCPRGARCGAVPCSPLSKGTREWISEHLLPSVPKGTGGRRVRLGNLALNKSRSVTQCAGNALCA